MIQEVYRVHMQYSEEPLNNLPVIASYKVCSVLSKFSHCVPLVLFLWYICIIIIAIEAYKECFVYHKPLDYVISLL